jgi:phosphoglycolate phosphatase-like HAD superfamily hydrolase
VLTGGAGARAMTRAFEDVFGVSDGFRGLPMAGRTDAWILAQAVATHGLSCDVETLRRFRERYLTHLTGEVHQPGPRKGVMPGVRPLLDALSARHDAFLALLTGNVEHGARVKLEYFDLWRYFRCGAFGDAAQERNGLLSTALARVEACGGPSARLSDVVVVGDTPLDVAVARAGGVRSVAVATGSYDVATLGASGADAVLQDFSDLREALEALGF